MSTTPVHTLTDSELRTELDDINRARNRGREYDSRRWVALRTERARRTRIDREATRRTAR